MNLILDAGNTFLKIAVFDQKHLVELQRVSLNDAKRVLADILKRFKLLKHAIVSVVSDVTDNEWQSVLEDLHLVQLTHKTSLPFKNNYKTPQTLGTDRMALVAAAVQKYPGKNALIIDAGTCITFDFINSKNEYLGGSIAPGLLMRYKSLHEFTAKLPSLQPKFVPQLIGNSTINAIHTGVSNGLIAEINGGIKQFSNKYENLVVILAGGDANFLSKRLKNGIFVDPNFLLHGLNFILDYTIAK